MPIVFEKHIDDAKKLAVWEITEPLDFFLEKLSLEKVIGKNINRQLEQACSMYLLNVLSGEEIHAHMYKDMYGKPFIIDSQITVSFSHSKNMVACLVDLRGGPTGIDIEYMRPNMLELSKKFVSPDDISPFSGEMHCHIIWGGKEVLYKIYGKKELDFLKDLNIQYNAIFSGRILKNKQFFSHRLDHTKINNFILVWNDGILG